MLVPAVAVPDSSVLGHSVPHFPHVHHQGGWPERLSDLCGAVKLCVLVSIATELRVRCSGVMSCLDLVQQARLPCSLGFQKRGKLQMPQISNEMWGPGTRRGILSTTLLSYVRMALRNLEEVDNLTKLRTKRY